MICIVQCLRMLCKLLKRGVFLLNYFADVCPQRGDGSLRMSLKWAPLSIIYVTLEKKKGVLDSEIYSMLIVASCLKQDELFLTTQTVIPVFLCYRKTCPSGTPAQFQIYLDNGRSYADSSCIHAKSGKYLRYISAIFFGFSAKF